MGSDVERDEAESGRERGHGLGARIVDEILKRRILIYVVFLGGLFAWRFLPVLTPTIKKVPGLEKRGGGLVISGTDNAPDLLMQTVVQFQSDYPKIRIDLEGGGTVRALEDLLNKRAGVAALSRPPTERELRIAVEHGDSLLSFPIALGGIAILAPRAAGLEAITLDDLRGLLTGVPSEALARKGITRFYGPDPNSGLWEVLLERLGYEGVFQPRYIPLATGERVVEALRQDPNGIGFASDLTYTLPGDDTTIVELRVGASLAAAVLPTRAHLIEGGYPLYHHLYLCTTPGRDALAGGFVTYYTQPTGQRWVAKQGFLPARLPTREIRLTGKAA